LFIVLILGATLPFFIVPLFYMESKCQGAFPIARTPAPTTERCARVPAKNPSGVRALVSTFFFLSARIRLPASKSPFSIDLSPFGHY
jgi:hypothetical protein